MFLEVLNLSKNTKLLSCYGVYTWNDSMSTLYLSVLLGMSPILTHST